MERTPINPTSWSLRYGFNQAELIDGARKTLVTSGQCAIDANGQPQHAGDMAAQITLSLDNLEAVLRTAGMALSDVVHLRIYTTDVDACLKAFSAMASRLAAAGARPGQTMLGVSRLFLPSLMFEVEATAFR